jgi:probable rRNA maturation factor
MKDGISIPIFVESRYKVNRKRIKERIYQVLEKRGVNGPVEISVAIVGDRKMRELNLKYRNLDKTTNVLSFSQTEGEESVSSPEMLLLGDVIISYPQVINEASEKEVFVDDRIDELVEHGVLHLLGIHH